MSQRQVLIVEYATCHGVEGAAKRFCCSGAWVRVCMLADRKNNDRRYMVRAISQNGQVFGESWLRNRSRWSWGFPSLFIAVLCFWQLTWADVIEYRNTDFDRVVEDYSLFSGRPLLRPVLDPQLPVTLSTVHDVDSNAVAQFYNVLFASRGLVVVRFAGVDVLESVSNQFLNAPLAVSTNEVPKLETALVKLDHAFPEFVASYLRSNTTVTVQIDARQHGLILRGSQDALHEARFQIETMDQPQRVIRIDAIVSEVDLSTNDTSGVDVFQRAVNSLGGAVAGGVQGAAAGRGSVPVDVASTVLSPVNVLGSGAFWYTLKGMNLDVLLKFLSSDSRFNILSRPSVGVLDGATATLSIGQQRPYVNQALSLNSGQNVATVSTQGLSQVTASSVAYLDLFTTLKVTPKLGLGDVVELLVDQQENSFGGDVQLPTGPVPIVKSRKLQTHVQTVPGRVLLMGGLIQENDGQVSDGVPGLRKVPVIGRAFGERSSTFSRSELLILLSVTVEDEL